MTMAGAVIASAAVVVDAITAEAVKRPIVHTSAAETAATQRQFVPAVARPTLAAALSIREARDRRQGMSQRRTAHLMPRHLMPQRLMPRQHMRAAGHMVLVGRHTAVVENTSSFRLLKQAAQGKSKQIEAAERNCFAALYFSAETHTCGLRRL